jgi:hypothetical protein
MGPPPVTPRRTSRVGQWFAARSLAQIQRMFLLVVLVVTAAFGGLDTVDTRATLFKPGEEFSDGEFTVTIERARLVTELKGGGHTLGPAKPGMRYLGVVATLRNDGTVPGRLRDELDLRDQPDQQFFGAYRNRDGSPIQTLGPGLTESVAFMWTLPETALQPGQSVTLRVWRKKYTQLMVTYGGKEWIEDLFHYGQTTVSVAA